MRLRALAVALFVAAWPFAALASEAETEAAIDDIGGTYGFVPGFFRLFPPSEIADAWYAFRVLELNPYLDIDGKTRELIGVAVATQGPCRPCVYFHAAAAFANGATKEEVREAIGIGAATKRLDAFFVELGGDMDAFKREADLVLWGDVEGVERHGPPPGFCTFVIEWAGAGYVGCD